MHSPNLSKKTASYLDPRKHLERNPYCAWWNIYIYIYTYILVVTLWWAPPRKPLQGSLFNYCPAKPLSTSSILPECRGMISTTGRGSSGHGAARSPQPLSPSRRSHLGHPVRSGADSGYASCSRISGPQLSSKPKPILTQQKWSSSCLRWSWGFPSQAPSQGMLVSGPNDESASFFWNAPLSLKAVHAGGVWISSFVGLRVKARCRMLVMGLADGAYCLSRPAIPLTQAPEARRPRSSC